MSTPCCRTPISNPAMMLMPVIRMPATASRSEIQQAQQQLKSQGLYHGTVDGVMGPETQTAVMAFQRQQGLPATAQLDQQTMSALSGGGAAGGTSPTGGMQQPGAAGMQPGGSSPSTPPASTYSPGSTPGGATGR